MVPEKRRPVSKSPPVCAVFGKNQPRSWFSSPCHRSSSKFCSIWRAAAGRDILELVLKYRLRRYFWFHRWGWRCLKSNCCCWIYWTIRVWSQWAIRPCRLRLINRVSWRYHAGMRIALEVRPDPLQRSATSREADWNSMLACIGPGLTCWPEIWMKFGPSFRKCWAETDAVRWCVTVWPLIHHYQFVMPFLSNRWVPIWSNNRCSFIDSADEW